MTMRALFFLLSMAAALNARAQLAHNAFHLDLNVLKPTYTDFVGNTSTGVRLGFTRFYNASWAAGIDLTYNTLDDYVPPATYQYPDGAITTDIFNYQYYFTVAVNGQYTLVQSGRWAPYVSLGMGAAFSGYSIFYNVYSDSSSKVGFLARPGAGVMTRFGKYSSLGARAGVSFEYATVQDDYFSIENFSGLTFHLGLTIFND